HIIVQGDVVTVKINGETINVYDQSKDENRKDGLGSKKLDHGTIALQAHDPNSVIYYKSVKVKVLPD
ncbi:MAG: family 16 glycoside hydrolase, partial [Algoriphagus sp.]